MREGSLVERWGLAVVLVFLLAGCGTAPTPRVATAHPSTGTGGSASAVAAPSTQETNYEKGLRYTRCMTGHGAPTADPVEGKPIRGGGGILSGESLDDYDKRQAAYEKCKQFMPVIWPVKVDPKDIARNRAGDQCMREHGIPEPVPDKNGLMNEPTDNRLWRMPGYDAALRACRHLYDDPANNDPANK